MAGQETSGSGSPAGDLEEGATLSDAQEMAPRIRDHIQQVAIEKVHVGDYVFLDADTRPVNARCVIRKYAKANERTSRVVGWLLELTGGHLAWWPRGGLVWRCRIPSTPIRPTRQDPRTPI